LTSGLEHERRSQHEADEPKVGERKDRSTSAIEEMLTLWERYKEENGVLDIVPEAAK